MRSRSRLTFPLWAGSTRAAFAHGLAGDLIAVHCAEEQDAPFAARYVLGDANAEDRARGMRGIPSVFA